MDVVVDGEGMPRHRLPPDLARLRANLAIARVQRTQPVAVGGAGEPLRFAPRIVMGADGYAWGYVFAAWWLPDIPPGVLLFVTAREISPARFVWRTDSQCLSTGTGADAAADAALRAWEGTLPLSREAGYR